MFKGKREVRFAKVCGRYSVSDDGVVWSDGLPLSSIGGVGVNIGGKRVKIAYLVARAFVPNAEMRAWVRHKNGDVTDNRASNLEWSDEKEERRRGRKPMVCLCKAWDCEGKEVGIWESVQEASMATGVREESIRACMAGKQKRAGGLLWARL